MGLSTAAKEKMRQEFVRAAAAGHDANDLVEVREGRSILTFARCSCGWTSTPRPRKLVAASAGYWHVLEVCAALDERKRLDLVEWSAAPQAKDLKRVEAHRARVAADQDTRR